MADAGLTGRKIIRRPLTFAGPARWRRGFRRTRPKGPPFPRG